MTQPANKRLVTEATQATALAGKQDAAQLDADSAALWNNPGSAFRTAADADLNSTFAPHWKPSTAYAAGDKVVTPSGALAVRRTAGTSGTQFDGTNWIVGQQASDNIPTVKPTGDGRPGVWEFTHNDSTGYLFHLLAGANFASPAAILAIGNDNGNGTSLLLPNKASGKAIVIDQRATVTEPTAYGMQATQSSTAAPLIRLEQNVAGAADALQLIAFSTPTATQNLLYVSDPTGEAGVVRAATGILQWKRNIVIMDKSGAAPSYLDVTDNSGVPANQATHTLVRKSGVEFYNYSGSAGAWWPFRLTGGGSAMRIQAGGTTGTVGTATVTDLMVFQNGKLSFFGGTTSAQKARVGALVDSSGGTAGATVTAAPAAYSQTDEANFRASLVAKINALEAVLSAAGGGFGLTS